MGFEDSLFRSATRLFDELDADLVVISPQYQFMVLPSQFSERRLYQALSVPGVASIASLRLGPRAPGAPVYCRRSCPASGEDACVTASVADSS